MNIILNIIYININNVFQQHAFINMKIVASVCVNITPNTSRNFIYSALLAKNKTKQKNTHTKKTNTKNKHTKKTRLTLIVQYAPSSDSGLSKKLALYSGSMHRLTWVFAGRTYIVLVRFVVRFIKPFIWDFKPRSTYLDVKTHSFELSLASIALVCVKCVFVWQTPFSHGLSYWFNASLIAEALL